MNLKKQFESLIDRKRAEIEEAQQAIMRAEVYIQAMTDALKKLPKDLADAPVVRAGSEVERIRAAILAAGQAMHLNQIVEALGRSDDPEAKAKIAGLLGWYICRNKVFTKTAPNTFGLVELTAPDLPEGFGQNAEITEENNT